MIDYTAKVADVQQQITDALSNSDSVKLSFRPRLWDGAAFKEDIVPIAVIRVSRLEHTDRTGQIVSKLASDNNVAMMIRRDGRLRPRKMLVYIKRKKSELVTA